MLVNKILEHINPNPNQFLQDYLTALGVTDIGAYLNHSDSNYDNPFEYQNMEESIERLKVAIDLKEDIGILVDSDADGYFSSAIIYQLISQVSDGSVTPKLFFHAAKQHGLSINEDENIPQQILNSNCTLLIIPDAGSNDNINAQSLFMNDIDIIVIDHHEVDPAKRIKTPYLVNHHLDKTHTLNYSLSGTGVAYKFAQAFGIKYQIDLPDSRDLVMISLISDECSLVSLENETFLYNGYQVYNGNYGNKFMKYLGQKVGKGPANARKFAWRIVPMFNAIARDNNMETKETMFRALVGELPPEDGYKAGNQAHRKQRKITEDLAKEVEGTIDFSKKVLIGFTEPEHKAYIGLTANKFMGKYNKPTIILREESSTTWSGSLRSPVNLANKINQTKLADCAGHLKAAGIYVKKANLQKLKKWLENNLDLSEDTIYNAVGEISPNDINVNLCNLCSEENWRWGSGNGNIIIVPRFYFNLNLESGDICILGKKEDTLKFTVDGVDFLKFRLNQDEVGYLKSIGKCNFQLIGTLNVNEYNGTITPQVLIEHYEIVESEDSWEDLF